jgi:hypothetical protein
MTRHAGIVFAAIALVGLVAALSPSDGLAQEKQKLSYKGLAEHTKYTQQMTLDVGDTPGHQVRVFEIHRTFPTDAPVINGLKLKETWTRGISDYTDMNGPSTSYVTYVFENGDKMFSHSMSMGQKNASGKRSTSGVGKITGGTGKFVGIQGVTRSMGVSDFRAGENATETELEYWFVK